MNEWFYLLLALVAGIVLGISYFGGLWLTLLRLSGSRHPALLAFGSFIGRSGIILAGFYLVTDGQWERLAASLAGFVISRQFLIHRLRPTRPDTRI
jgi:F1F0 ATPase subunit 2